MKIEQGKVNKDTKGIVHPQDQAQKIDEIKTQIQNGTYKIDAAKLVQKILESGVLDD